MIDPTGDKAIRRYIRAQIRDALKTLPDVERRVFTLKVVVGRSFEEIDHIHGQPDKWAEEVYARALENLRELLR